MEDEGDSDINCNWLGRDNLQSLGKRNGRFRNEKTSRDHLNYSIIMIGQNTEESPRDMSFKYEKWLNISIWLIDGIIKGNTTPGQSESWVLYIPIMFRTEISQSDVI